MRNVSPNVTEEQLKETFGEYGAIEKAKKVKDFAFIHFTERDSAVKAMEAMDKSELDGVALEVTLARPQPSNKDRRRGGQGGYGGPRGGPRGGPPGRDRGGSYGGDRRGYSGYDGYDQGYDGYDQGYYGGGGYSYREDHGDSYYDDYYGGGYGYGDRYSEGPRGGRGGPPRGGRGGPPGRGGSRGGGYPGRGGDRGGRGGPPRGGPPRGRGGPPGRGGPRGGGVAPAKRKYGADSMQAPVEYPEPKRRFMGQSQGGGWGSQPIAQQPLYDGGYGSHSSNQEWYSDSFGQQW